MIVFYHMVSKPGEAVPGCAAFTYCGLWGVCGALKLKVESCVQALILMNWSFIKTNAPTAAELVELMFQG